MLLLTKQNLEKQTRDKKMIINTEIQNKKTIYSFESRGVNYTVFQDSDNTFEVWSQRKALSFGPSIRIFNSLNEMGSATKALSGLAALIAA